MHKHQVPTYQNDLKGFIFQLREGLALTLEQVATAVGKHHTTISRYESHSHEIKRIPFDYFMALTHLYLQNLSTETEQNLLLTEVNRAIADYYKGRQQAFANLMALRNYTVKLSRAQEAPPLKSTHWPAPPPVDPLKSRARFAGYLSLHELFGVSAARERLLQALQNPHDHWIMVIDGLGGIGKTTLASHLTELCLPYFHDVLWLSAKQEKFDFGRGIEPLNNPVFDPTILVDELLKQLDPNFELGRMPAEKQAILAHWLQERPYLVVIDNLETLADNKALLPVLRHLIRPTKFLLTTRWHEEQDVVYESLGEWSLADSVAFLRYWGKIQAMPALSEANDLDLKRIYDVVGGNPLALKLVAGQLKTRNLSQVLAELKAGFTQNMNQFYTYLYYLAWQDLDEVARKVLIELLFLRDYDDLARKFEPEKLDPALTHLQSRSLIELHGNTLDERTYQLHRLTETFLQTQIIQCHSWTSLQR